MQSDVWTVFAISMTSLTTDFVIHTFVIKIRLDVSCESSAADDSNKKPSLILY